MHRGAGEVSTVPLPATKRDTGAQASVAGAALQALPTPAGSSTPAAATSVTGAGSGIGAATAIAIARQGAMVLICDIDQDNGEKTVDLISAAGGNASYFHIHVVEPASHYAAVTEAKRLYGGLDVAVNCAGISVGPRSYIRRFTKLNWKIGIGYLT